MLQNDCRVLIYRNELLGASETFIRAQASFLTRWHPVLVGQRRVAAGLDLGPIEAMTLASTDGGAGDVVRRLKLRMHLPHKPTIRALERLDARVIHAHFGTDAVDIWPNAKALNVPMLVTLHGYDITVRPDWWRRGHGGWARMRYPSQLLQLAEEPKVGFIAVSDAIRRCAIARGIPANRIVRRHIGIDTQAFSGAERPAPAPRVLFVGRLIEKKGAEILIRAFSRVRRSIPDATLAILGDGPLSERLSGLARELDLPVEFLGQRGPEEVRRELLQARVFCLPSITAANGDSEGLPIVVLEAQAMGVPVVTSAQGGAEEGIRDGETGFAFPPGDVDALSSLLEHLLADDVAWSRMAGQAPKYMRSTFEIRERTASLEALYDRVASDGNFSSELAF